MNASTISAALAAHAEAVCRHYLPQGRKQGRFWIAGNIDGNKGRSLFVRLSGPGTPGKWTDAAEWRPAMNRCWFAPRIIAVKHKYALTVDASEAAALTTLLAPCTSTDMQFTKP